MSPKDMENVLKPVLAIITTTLFKDAVLDQANDEENECWWLLFYWYSDQCHLMDVADKIAIWLLT